MEVPEIVFCGVEGERDRIGYIVETYIPGRVLKEEFCHLNSEKKLRLMFDVGRFLGKINVNSESMKTIKICSKKIMEAILEKDVDTDLSLLHRDYGFRNIMIENDEISGVIDFEYAIPGDKYFDLSKIIFNDLDFETDTELREAFFNGWSEVTKEEIDWDRM